jgi:hypothetical protein
VKIVIKKDMSIEQFRKENELEDEPIFNEFKKRQFKAFALKHLKDLTHKSWEPLLKEAKIKKAGEDEGEQEGEQSSTGDDKDNQADKDGQADSPPPPANADLDSDEPSDTEDTEDPAIPKKPELMTEPGETKDTYVTIDGTIVPAGFSEDQLIQLLQTLNLTLSEWIASIQSLDVARKIEEQNPALKGLIADQVSTLQEHGGTALPPEQNMKLNKEQSDIVTHSGSASEPPTDPTLRYESTRGTEVPRINTSRYSVLPF